MPKELSFLSIPFNKKSMLCECLQPGKNEFLVRVSHAEPGSVEMLFNIYKGKFEAEGYQLATAKETEELIRKASPSASKIQEYFFKDQIMVGCKVEDNINKSGLKVVTLKDYSKSLIGPGFDLASAKAGLDETFQRLIKSADSVDAKTLPQFKFEDLKGRTVLFQIYDVFAKGAEQYDRKDVAQLVDKHNAADVIALVNTYSKSSLTPEEARENFREGVDQDGRKITYFKGSTRSGRVYFIEKESGKVMGTRTLSASNSNVTSDPGKDLLTNYYLEVEKLEKEFKALDRSMK